MRKKREREREREGRQERIDYKERRKLQNLQPRHWVLVLVFVLMVQRL